MDIAKLILRKPELSTPGQYRAHVLLMNIFFPAMFLTAVLGIVILLARTKLLITLTQRSNVETLTLAFLLLFFAYLCTLSARGFIGSARNLAYAFLGLMKGRPYAEARKHASLGRKERHDPPACVALSQLVRLGDAEEFELPVRDEFGEVGRFRFRGARITMVETIQSASNSLFAFLIEQINTLLRERGRDERVEILEWSLIDEEELEKFLGLVTFASNLGRAVGKPDCWPSVALEHDDRENLEQRLGAICPYLRSEALLPHWEYSADHKLPIIPEPLGIISLGRSERRVDPLASMAACLAASLLSLFLLLFVTLEPPWVPGK